MFYRGNINIKSYNPILIHIPRTGGTMLKAKSLNIDNASHTPISKIKHKIKDRYTFCFVRNPYERFYSACIYNGVKNIDEFTKSLINDIDCFSNYDIKHIEHFFTQSHFITINNKIVVDDVFKYSQFNNALKVLRNKGIIFKDNFKYKTPKSKYYKLSKDAMCLLDEIYKKDFELC